MWKSRCYKLQIAPPTTKSPKSHSTHGYMSPQICSDCVRSCRSFSQRGLPKKTCEVDPGFSLFVHLFLGLIFCFRFHLLFNHRTLFCSGYYVFYLQDATMTAQDVSWWSTFTWQVKNFSWAWLFNCFHFTGRSRHRLKLLFLSYSRCLSSLSWEAMSDSSVQHASQSACVRNLTSAWCSPYKAIFCCQSLQWQAKFWQIAVRGEHEHS